MGQHSGFVKVRFGIGWLRCQFPVGHLDGDVPLKLIVVGEVDGPEPAFAQQTLDAVATDLRGADRLLRCGLARLRSGVVCRLSAPIV